MINKINNFQRNQEVELKINKYYLTSWVFLNRFEGALKNQKDPLCIISPQKDSHFDK